MSLTNVTITGADSNTNVDDLIDLAWTYPFVEWGILFGSREKEGRAKFPIQGWIQSLLDEKDDGYFDFQVAAHLCAPWPDRMIAHHLTWPEIGFFSQFDRIQINRVHKQDDTLYKLFTAAYKSEKPIIFQNNGSLPVEELYHFCEPIHFKPRVNILFDRSGGQGTEIGIPPAPLPGFKTGYAGGIGPDNIERIINEINTLYPELDYWIDMETNVRTDDKLDMKKVMTCLKIASGYVK